MTDSKADVVTEEGSSAATTPVSLAQTILAATDAVLKTQIHAARSFLNLVLQIGFPHGPLDENKQRIDSDDRAYTQNFYYDVNLNGVDERRKVTIPTLALVPVTPLAIESANIKLEMRISHVAKHQQLQESERKKLKEKNPEASHDEKSPWFLVPDPISIRGTLAPTSGSTQNGSTIQIEIKMGKTAMPSGLDKLLTHLTQSTQESKSSIAPTAKSPDIETK